ncbi:exodeoxyribonuclease V subunit gamma [Shewanella marina]|uniref:exodeoxyribonuclease V subunit gamma n=1 Tax=Shewanella marina TaxID=487319 RepID=UPI00047067D0|nr:exodeoxyribonuclease V subunit gamma [Shewanella marina]
MLYLIQSNQMERLSSVLAGLLSSPLENMSMLENEHILVQSPGMSTWLRLEIAKHNQVAAALSFPLPSSFTWQLCHTLLANVPKENAFTKPLMTWKLMGLLPSLLEQTEFSSLKNYLADSQPLKLYQLCGRIADIFDQYLVYRPDWITAWEHNENPISLNEEQAWQPILWRALINYNANELHQSHYHRANLHQALADALADPNTDISKLPKRLFVFGISSMAPQTLQILHYLSSRIDVYMLNLSPCQHYWGDIIDPKQRARMALAYGERKQLTEDWQDKLEVGNPILANNGKMGRELLDLLLELPENSCQLGFDSYHDLAADNLLHGVQYDILQLETRGRSLGPDAALYLSTDDRRILKADDSSITLRSCHSPLREIETLHDHLLNLLSEQPQLQAKDIVVMLPDVASYAPYIDAVFSSKQGQHYIPYAIADRGAAQESPLINSFLSLLNLNQSRFALTEILSILEVPAVLRRFDLIDEDLAQIRRWLEQAAVRWGRDEQSRIKQDVPAFSQNSWAFGIKRLILGYALTDNSPLYHDVLAVDGIEGQSAQALGKLLDFISSLDQLMAQLSQEANIGERIEQLQQLLNDFYDTDDDERQQLQEIRDAQLKLSQEFTHAGIAYPVASDIIQNWFKQALSESRVGQRYLAGSVNFCTLMPMRSIPFKVVCLLGMNDGVYPRVQHPIGFDLVAHMGPRKGDRSRRLDDRYLFLEALLSARDQLYISYIGHSERDNSERIPSMLVSELVEYCQLSYQPETLMDSDDIEKIENNIAEQMIVEMPLQPFDGKLYDSTKPEQQSYANQWCPSSHIEQAKFVDPQTSLEQFVELEQQIELSALIRFYRNPSQYFFNRTLKLDLALDIQADDNDEPFSLNALARYKLQFEMVNDGIEHQSEIVSHDLIGKYKASGNLPMAPFDQLLINQYQHDIKPLIGRTLYLTGESLKQVNVELSFAHPLHELQTIQLVGRIDDVGTKGLVNYRPGGANGNDLVRVYLRHLCLNAMGYNKPSYLLDIGHFHSFAPLTPMQAKNQLSVWLAYFLQGQARPLPFMAKTSLAYTEADGEHSEKLLQARAVWLDENTDIGEGQNPHYRRLFSFPDDFDKDSFGAVAGNLLHPLLSLYHKDKLSQLSTYVESAQFEEQH